MAVITGTNEPDFLEGLGGDDRINGRGGDDEIYGYNGADHITGGGGADYIFGGNGVDRLIGGAGDDALYGGNDAGLLDGGSGDDVLRGGNGVDNFQGGDGIDYLSFYDLTATQGVIADLRSQTIRNDGFGNTEGMSSIEKLGLGGVYADIFYGNDLNNSFSLFRGDKAFGFAGDDTIYVSTFDKVRARGGDGNDTLGFLDYEARLTDSGTIVTINRENGVIADLSLGRLRDDGYGFGARIDDFENLSGSGKNDRLTGSSSTNLLAGGYGDDFLLGKGGNDILSGGGGRDRLTGGSGDDILVADGDYDILLGDGGSDLFRIGSQFAGTISVDEYDHGIVVDFEQQRVDSIEGGDKIDLSFIRKGSFTAFDSFEFIGTDTFTTYGQVRYEIVDGITVIQLSIDLDTEFDQMLTLQGSFELTAADFIL